MDKRTCKNITKHLRGVAWDNLQYFLVALLALSKSEREVLTLERFVQSQSILIKKENASAPCIEINESLGYVGKGGTFFSLVKIVFSVIPMMAKLTFI